jgi:hypothetical protein
MHRKVLDLFGCTLLAFAKRDEQNQSPTRKTANLLVVDSGQAQGLGNPNNQSLGAIRRAALGYVRTVIDAEILRLLGGGD